MAGNLDKPTKPQWADGLPAYTDEPSAGQKGTGWLSQQKPPFQWMNWLFLKIKEWIDFSERFLDIDQSFIFRSDAIITWSGTQITFAQDLELRFKVGATFYNNSIALADSPLALADGDVVVLIKDDNDVALALQAVYGSLAVGEYAIEPVGNLTQNTDEHELILFRRRGSNLEIPMLRQVVASGGTLSLGSLTSHDHSSTSQGGDTIALGDDSSIAAAKKWYWDGGGNTYDWESAADIWNKIVGGVDVFECRDTFLQCKVDFLISATQPIRLDGSTAGNTYFEESAPDIVDWYVGGALVWQFRTTFIACNVDLVMGATDKVRYDGSAVGDTYEEESSADVLDKYVGGTLAHRINGSGETFLAAADPPTANYMNRNAIVKAWVYYNDGAPGSVINSYNIDQVTSDDGDGIYAITWNTDFVGNYSVNGTVNNTSDRFVATSNLTTAGISVRINDVSAAGLADDNFMLIAIGDQ